MTAQIPRNSCAPVRPLPQCDFATRIEGDDVQLIYFSPSCGSHTVRDPSNLIEDLRCERADGAFKLPRNGAYMRPVEFALLKEDFAVYLELTEDLRAQLAAMFESNLRPDTYEIQRPSMPSSQRWISGAPRMNYLPVQPSVYWTDPRSSGL